ncbi:MAG TPA: hypothetical protein VI821_00325 [Candidatus Paceibacterota bacterium]
MATIPNGILATETRVKSIGEQKKDIIDYAKLLCDKDRQSLLKIIINAKTADGLPCIKFDLLPVDSIAKSYDCMRTALFTRRRKLLEDEKKKPAELKEPVELEDSVEAIAVTNAEKKDYVIKFANRLNFTERNALFTCSTLFETETGINVILDYITDPVISGIHDFITLKLKNEHERQIAQ